MKKITHAFLVILLVIGCTTCKKENIEKELPWLIGKWKYFAVSTCNHCVGPNQAVNRVLIIDIDFDTINGDFLDENFTLEFLKKKMKINYSGKSYIAYVNKNSYSTTNSFNKYPDSSSNYLGLNFNKMEYIPNVSNVDKITDYYMIELDYKKGARFTNSEVPIVIKKVSGIDNTGNTKEFLQVFFPDILGKELLYKLPSTNDGYYNCGGFNSLITLTFIKE